LVAPDSDKKDIKTFLLPHEMGHFLVRPMERIVDNVYARASKKEGHRSFVDEGVAELHEDCADESVNNIVNFAVPLIKENERLKKQNARLRAQLVALQEGRAA